MSESRALEGAISALTHYDLAVEATYRAAVASGWSAEFREPLWQAGLDAVLAYARRAPDAPAARRFFHLVVDLAPQVPQSEFDAWPEETRRALRLAATHTLVYPGRPHHRPRAQSLLKRLDSLENPILSAREALLGAIAHQRQVLKTGMRGESRLAPVTLQAHHDLLTLVTACLRELLDYPKDREEAVLEALSILQVLVETGEIFDDNQEDTLFSLLQLLRNPDRPLVFLDEALEALAVVRAHVAPGLHHSGAELKRVLFDLDLGRLTDDDREAFTRHLAAFTHLARNLQEIPAANLPGLLYRLRHRLADPSSETVERLIDESLATLDRLARHRERLLAEAPDTEAPPTRVQILDELREAVYDMQLAGITAAQATGVVQVLRQVENLAEAADRDSDAIDDAAEHLARQLRRPRLIGNRVWQSAQTAIKQAHEQKHVLDETLRGLQLDRRLTVEQREASRGRLKEQLDSLDRARILMQSLPFDQVDPERERDAQVAMNDFVLGMRVYVAAGDPAKMRSALHALTRICSRSM